MTASGWSILLPRNLLLALWVLLVELFQDVDLELSRLPVLLDILDDLERDRVIPERRAHTRLKGCEGLIRNNKSRGGAVRAKSGRHSTLRDICMHRSLGTQRRLFLHHWRYLFGGQ